MARYLALLRGINVGRAKRVGMEDLRQAFTDLGYADVKTFLNSGNVIFTSPRRLAGDAASRSREAIRARTGVTSQVTLIAEGDLRTILSECPLLKLADDPRRLLVAVTTKDGIKKLQKLARSEWTPEVVAVGSRAGYIWSPQGTAVSAAFRAIDRELGEEVTTRNWATMTKLAAAMDIS